MACRAYTADDSRVSWQHSIWERNSCSQHALPWATCSTTAPPCPLLPLAPQLLGAALQLPLPVGGNADRHQSDDGYDRHRHEDDAQREQDVHEDVDMESV